MSAPNLIYPPSTGGGGGGVSGSGTPNFLPIWSTATSLSDSPLSFSGSTLTFSSSVTTQAFASPQSWTIPANTAGWRINTTQLIFDTSAGQLGIGTPSGPAAPLHVEGAVGAGELFRLRNQSTGASAHVTIRTHANALGSGSPSGLIQNFVSSTTPGFGVYDWVYSLPTPGGVMTEVLRSTAPTAILTVALTSGGTGYTNGTYSQVALTNVSSSGTGATADIVVAATGVTTVALRSGGSGYQVGDTLSAGTIGGGTGFVLTVASVGSMSTATAAVTAPRIGAGTTTPRASIDMASGCFIATSTEQIVRQGTTAGSFFRQYTTILVQPAEQATVANTSVVGITSSPQIDFSLMASGALLNGYSCIASPTVTTASQSLTLGGYTTALYRAKSGDISTGSTTVRAFLAQYGVLAGVGAASTTACIGFHSLPFIDVVGHTIGSFSHFLAGPPSFNSASTITNYYGLRLEAFTGSGTITNRYPIAQEDTLGTNFVRAKTHFGAAVGTAAATTASIEVTAQGALNGDVRLNSANAVVDVSASSTNGVRFFNRAGTGQTSNTLNWYEEGTYTPTTSNFTLGTCTATWTRIGRKVFVTLNFAAGANNGSTVAGASSLGLPAGLAPVRNGCGFRMQVTGAASGNGVVAVNAATGLIEISSTVTLDTNAKIIQAEYEV